MQQATLADLQDEHLCDLQPEDLSLHSNGGDDRQAIDETEQTSTEELVENELLWKQETSLTEASKPEEASCTLEETIGSEECKESAGRLSSRDSESTVTTVGENGDLLEPAGDITTTSASVQDATTASPDGTVVTKLEEAIATPTEKEQEHQ